MNEEQLQRHIDFITQSHARFAANIEILTEKSRASEEEHERLRVKLDDLSKTVQNLVLLSRDFLEVEQIHSRRLDRLEGIQPH